MTPASNTRISPIRDGFRHAALAAALVLAISACGGGDKPADTGTATAPTDAAAPVAQPPAQAISAQVAAMSVDQLRAAARTAQNEQRMYAPAGNNAMEYYLALRDKQPNDAAVTSALTDLMPYALMEKTDKAAPALPRLKQSITDAQASFAQRQQQQVLDAEAEKERLAKLEEDRKKQQEEQQKLAAERLAQQQQQQAAAAQAQREADARRQEEARVAAERTRREEEERRRRETSTTAAPATASANDLRLISQSAPKYPPEAFRDRVSGEVQVEFTVGTDGTVTNARVVRGNPPRVFDREAVAAVKRWRYQPIASPVTTRQTIAFKP